MLAGLALLVAGCSRRSDPGPATPVFDPTTAPPSSTASTRTTAPPTPEEAATAAYLETMRLYFVRVGSPEGPWDDVETRHTGPSLKQVIDELRRLRTRHQQVAFGVNGAPLPEVSTVTVRGDAAEMTVCIVDDTRLLDSRTKATINAEVISKTFQVRLLRIDGTWRLSEQIRTSSTVGSGGCG